MSEDSVKEFADIEWEKWRPGFQNSPMPDIVWEICSSYRGAYHDVFCKRIFSNLLAEVGSLKLTRKLSDKQDVFQ